LQNKGAEFTITEMKKAHSLNILKMKQRLGQMYAKKLLRNKKVIEEINRHKWLESEIAGYDIGFEAATEDWLKRHAAAWVAYHSGRTPKHSVKPRILSKKFRILSKRKKRPAR
jgi:hypothetical protein